MAGEHSQTNNSSLMNAGKSELSVEDGCILWGSRVVVPPPGRVPIIKILHDGHPRGISNEISGQECGVVART